MPRPTVNRAVDIILAAFPESEVIGEDRTKRLPVHTQARDKVVEDGWQPVQRTTKPPPKRTQERRFKPGTKKPGKNQEGML